MPECTQEFFLFSEKWEAGEDLQQADQPRENEELREHEKALPPLKFEALRRAAATSGVSVDGHPEAPLYLPDESCEKWK